MKHDLYGPSGEYIIANCPGSAREQAGLASVESKDSTDGDKCHEYLAAILMGREIMDPDIDSELFRLAQDAAQKFRSAAGPDPFWHVEETLEYELCGELRTGTPDAYVVDGANSLILGFDLKSGHDGINRDAALWQGSAYGFAAAVEHACERAVWYFYAPRTGEFEIVEVDDLMATKAALEAPILESRKPDARLSPGSWCRYCKARGLCTATQDAANKFVVEATGGKPLTKAEIEHALHSMTVEKLQPLADQVEVVEWAVKAVRDRIRECLKQEEGCVKGWKLSTENGRRAADASEVNAKLRDVNPDDIIDCCTLSVPKLEKMLKARPNGAETWQSIQDLIRQNPVTKLKRAKQ